MLQTNAVQMFITGRSLTLATTLALQQHGDKALIRIIFRCRNLFDIRRTVGGGGGGFFFAFEDHGGRF